MSDNNELLSILKNTDYNLDTKTHQEMEQLWERISDADPAESVKISDKQKNQAYQKVKTQIQSDRDSKTSKNGISFFKYAAAAVLLIAAGLAYVLIPVTVNTPYGKTQTVILPDQSTVELNSGSEITYSRLFGIWERKVALRGEAFFDVQSHGTSFHVTTENASVEVLGTKFNVRFWPSEVNQRTMIFLSEGSVAFKSLLSDNDPVTLQAGERSWVSSKQQIPAEPVKIDKEEALAWQNKSLAFEKQPLSAIFGELERRFDVTISGHPDIMNEKITIYLQDIENIESALKDICRAYGLTYKKKNGRFLVYRN
jgi:ferric-dicitrate binding protein FerR (iron transport regulator)